MKTKKLTIIGRGVDPTKHLSMEALEILKTADLILGIESEIEFWSMIQKNHNITVIKDIASEYKNNNKDILNYQSFIDLAFHSLINNDHVVLLVAGHPRLGVTFSQLLSSDSRSAGINIQFVVGISSFDVMLNDLALDPIEQGTALLDANRLLLFEYKMETSLNYFIYHVSSVGNSKTNYQNPEQGNQVTLLKNYLIKHYSSSKKVAICQASNGKNSPSQYTWIDLSELESSISKLNYSTTLYIPAELPEKINFEFLHLLENT
jgi:uncharacterized protein YabN with tetrapyrrole methylase and pyrophosphatase domain